MKYLVPLVSALVLLAALAAPALADKPRMVVDKDGSVTFDGIFFGSAEAFHKSQEFKTQGVRCATESNKALLVDKLFPLKAAADCTMSSTTIQSAYNPANGSVYTIPVVFHIIKKTDGTGNIAQSLITSQVDILNEDYRALTGTPGALGTDAKIQFVLATEDPNGNATTGINYYTSNAYFTDPGPGAANDMKQALNWDPTRYLNVYTNDANGALGYATFPQQDAGTYQDGVVLLWSSVGRNAPGGGIYDQGRTATHEVGHYLGLFHTFQSGCGTASAPYTTGDLIADTNRQQSANFDCPSGATSCSSPDPIENYMNYTQDTCMELFTSEQVNRMRCALESYRPNLGAGGGGGGGGGGNVLDNGVPKTGLAASSGGALNYTMTVPSGASDLQFQISGGSGDADLYVRFGSAPTTSAYDCRPYLSGNNETCSFATPSAGTWHVMVRAYSTFSGVSLVGSYSTGPSNTPPTAGFSHTTNYLAASFTDTSSDPDGSIVSWSWTFGDGATSTSQNPSHTYASAGTRTVTLTVTDDDGATDSTSASVTVTAPPSSNELENGVPVTGLSAATGQEVSYTMTVPSGATNLVFETSGGTGDADLYVRFGSAPTTSAYDCRPYKGGNAETCTFATPSAGTWYVMLRAYNAFSGVTLEGSYATGGGGGSAPCTGCDHYSGSLTGSGNSNSQPNGTYYQSAAGVHEGWLEGPAAADFDLELYRWTGAWTKVASSTSASSSEHISYNGASGYYYWKILSYSGSGSYDFWLKRP